MARATRHFLERLLIGIGAVDPTPTAASADLDEGRVCLLGALCCSAPVLSPIHHREVAAYFYRASSVGSGRSSDAARMRSLRRATVYADGLSLQMQDATIALAPPSSDAFDPAAHDALVALDLPGFRAVETTLRDGMPVRVLGDAHCANGVWSVCVLQMERQDSPAQVPSPGA